MCRAIREYVLMARQKPMKDSNNNMDTESVGSTLSVFSTDEYRRLRTEVLYEGFLDVMDGMISSSDADNFKQMKAILTKDGRMTLEDPNSLSKQKKYLIEECNIQDNDSLIRLKVICESDLQSKVDEIICRCEDIIKKNKWLISIESSIRHHMRHMFNEMDCIRGYLKITFYEEYKDYDLNKDLQKCFCFYYHGTLRVKGLDLRGTLSFKIKSVKFDLGKYPSSFIIEAHDGDLLCFCEDVDMFALWRLNMKRDFPPDDHHKTSMQIFSGDLLTRNDLLDFFTRMKCTYYKSTRSLEMRDLTNEAATYFVLRCGITPARNNADHHFAILVKGGEGSTENINIYCRAANLELARQWVEVMSPTAEQLAKLIKIIVVEIEVRRIFHHESSKKEPDTPITYHEINQMALLVDTQETELTSDNGWTVSRLERAVQLSFKILPEPLIPFNLQDKFNEIGKVMRKDKLPFEAVKKRIIELVNQLPPTNLDILQTMGGHVSRLVAHYKQVHSGASSRNTDLTVWRRLCKYILKTPDQIFVEKEEEELLKNTAYVLDSLKRHSEEKMRAMKSMRAKSRKSICKQQ